jgi:RimJ/RimL family protein N-acetyltransferase
MERGGTGDRAGMLETPRLRLVPTTVEHAAAFADVLEDPILHRHIGGDHRSRADWAAQLQIWSTRASPDGRQQWLNWAVGLLDDGTVIGWLQATVEDGHADIAFVIGMAWQGHGYAIEAAGAVVAHLLRHGVLRVGASIAPANRPSQSVVARLGFTRTGETDDDGEERWALSSPHEQP